MKNFAIIFTFILINETFGSSISLKKKNASPLQPENGKSHKGRRPSTSEDTSVITNRLAALKLSENGNTNDKNNSTKSNPINQTRKKSETLPTNNVSDAIALHTGVKMDKKMKSINDNSINDTRRHNTNDKNNSTRSNPINQTRKKSETLPTNNVSDAIALHTGVKMDKKMKSINDNSINDTRRQTEMLPSFRNAIVPYTGGKSKDEKMISINDNRVNEIEGQSEMFTSNDSNAIVPYTGVEKEKEIDPMLILKIEPRENSSATNESREKSPTTLKREELARDKKFVDEMIGIFSLARDNMYGKSEVKLANPVKKDEPLKKRTETKFVDQLNAKTAVLKNRGVRKEKVSQTRSLPQPNKFNVARTQDDSEIRKISNDVIADASPSTSSRFKPRTHAQKASQMLFQHLLENSNMPLDSIPPIEGDSHDERLKRDPNFKHPHPGAPRDIFFNDRLESYLKDYEFMLKNKNSPKLKKEQARKKRICETNSMKFTGRICGMIRHFYRWKGRTGPVCVSAAVGDHKTIEKVALCKLEWPLDKTFLTSPITSQLLYVGSDTRKPITLRHDIYVAFFDGLGEFEYFVARLERRYEHANAITDTKKIYKVSPVNVITVNASENMITEETKSDLTVIQEGIFFKYDKEIGMLSQATGMSIQDVSNALAEIGTVEYHAQSEFNIEDKVTRFVQSKLEMIEMFDKKFTARTDDDQHILEFLKKRMFGQDVCGFYM